jgi:hypothetical protein
LDDALSAIQNHAQIELVHETVLAKPKATHVFDSRPCDIETHQVTQSFVGIEVQFEHGYEWHSVRHPIQRDQIVYRK